MATNLLPLVGDTTTLGEAARAATDARVGAVVVASVSGLWVLPIGTLPDQVDGMTGEVISTLARRFEPPGIVDQPDFTLNSIKGGFAEVEADINHPWQINIIYGFKECNVNTAHTYPPTYRGTSCVSPCEGTLVTKL